LKKSYRLLKKIKIKRNNKNCGQFACYSFLFAE